jgi:pimeloyl-ACP methyl ester carboxylesterase
MKEMKNRRWIKALAIVLCICFAVSIAPYCIPVTTAKNIASAPFSESAFLETQGVSLHYRVWQPAEGACQGKVLLVHGLGGSTFCWRENIDALVTAGYLVLAVDLPGFGYSDRSRGQDHSQANRSLLLWSLLDSTDSAMQGDMKSGKWNLVGHSMGGGTVAQMALSNPERTQCVVFVDGAVLTDGRSLGVLLEYPPVQRWIEVLARNVFFSRDQFAKFLSSAYGRTPSEAEIDGYLDPLLLDGTEGTLIDLTRSATTMEADALKPLSVPVYGIWGEEDSWVPLEEANRLQATLPSMQLMIVPGAGHCPMETHSASFNQFLLQALASAND